MVTMILIIVTTILTRVTTISIIKIALASDFPYSIPPITHESFQAFLARSQPPTENGSTKVIIPNIYSFGYDSYFFTPIVTFTFSIA